MVHPDQSAMTKDVLLMRTEASKLALESAERTYRFFKNIRVHCPSCRYFGIRGMCDRWGQQVPVDVQPVGCDDWVYDDIPF